MTKKPTKKRNPQKEIEKHFNDMEKMGISGYTFGANSTTIKIKKPTKDKACCEKCDTSQLKVKMFVCNGFCPCHQPPEPKPSWEEELIKRLDAVASTEAWKNEIWREKAIEIFKSFIQSLLQEAREEVVKEIREKLPLEENVQVVGCDKCPEQRRVGYHNCLSRVNQILNQLNQ